MSVPPISHYFEYSIEVPLNDDIEKNTENVINYLNQLSPQPFIIQYCWSCNFIVLLNVFVTLYTSIILYIGQ